MIGRRLETGDLRGEEKAEGGVERRRRLETGDLRGKRGVRLACGHGWRVAGKKCEGRSRNLKLYKQGAGSRERGEKERDEA
jgi:hypothetical protein